MTNMVLNTFAYENKLFNLLVIIIINFNKMLQNNNKSNLRVRFSKFIIICVHNNLQTYLEILPWWFKTFYLHASSLFQREKK